MVRYQLEKNPRASALRMSLILAILAAAVLASFAAIYHYALVPTIIGAIVIALLTAITNYTLSLRKIKRSH